MKSNRKTTKRNTCGPVSAAEAKRRRKALAEHGSVRKAARALGMAPTTLGDWNRRRSAQTQAPPQHAAPSWAVKASVFMAELDLAGKLREAIKQQLADQFVVEADFRASLNISTTQFRRLADRPEFEANQIKHAGKVWWSSAANVAAARKRQEEFR